ncbi:hypothetical protein AFK20_00290 [Enhydrobacter aerosaccus]|uniref:Uncharacterized protein n=1 Tax=Enhydrobacter aerosaccus TaxID=225324 RepID=A0ABR5ING6_9HYPH|nr:hypothetical protein AFK20_00290 [Enhydrobacter aerosaccus]
MLKVQGQGYKLSSHFAPVFSPKIALGKMPLFIVVPVYPIKGSEGNIIYTLSLMLVSLLWLKQA